MDCCICKDPLFDGNKLNVARCGHVFHMDCLDDAIRSDITLCPLCKVRLMKRHVSPLFLSAEDVPRPISSMKFEQNEQNENAEAESDSANNELSTDSRLPLSDISSSTLNTAQNKINDEKSFSHAENNMVNEPSNNFPIVEPFVDESPSSDVATSSTNGQKTFFGSVDEITISDIAVPSTSGQQTLKNPDLVLHKLSERDILELNDVGSPPSADNYSIAGPSTGNQNKNTGAVAKKVPDRRISKSIQYDRNVRIHHVPVEEPEEIECRRSLRKSVPVNHYNCGMVVCGVCKKSFRQDIAIKYYSGQIACSFQCFRNAP